MIYSHVSNTFILKLSYIYIDCDNLIYFIFLTYREFGDKYVVHTL